MSNLIDLSYYQNMGQLANESWSKYVARERKMQDVEYFRHYGSYYKGGFYEGYQAGLKATTIMESGVINR